MLALDQFETRTTESSLAPRAPDDEKAFYAHYGWCLNPQMNVAQAARHLRDELQRLSAPSGWQRREIAINIWLLASGILNAADEQLRGKTLRIARLRRLAAPIDRVAALPHHNARRALRDWRELPARRARKHVAAAARRADSRGLSRRTVRAGAR